MKRKVIEAKKLCKYYQMEHGRVHALKEASLDLFSGECAAIMGPSGSGKSTLLHLLGCLDMPSEGIYLLDGQDVSEMDDKELALTRATKIGFVFQSFNLIPQLNVFENVEVPFMYQQCDKKKVKDRIVESIERVKLGHRLYHRPTQLSGGEMQRVAIARALAIDPLLIFADEPTGNLDSETGKHILELFRELNEQGVTLLLITHDEKVGNSCKRIIRMRDGLVVSDLCY